MNNGAKILLTGGTITMGRKANVLEPCYDIKHLVLAVKAVDKVSNQEELKEILKEITSIKVGEKDDQEISIKLLKIAQKNNLNIESFEQLYNAYEIDAEIGSPYQNLVGVENSGVSEHFLIDSINFDFNIHYPPLLNECKKNLKLQKSVIVVGGTDTMEYYATALSSALKNENLITNNSITFVSSMSSFEDNPLQAAKILKAAIITANKAKLDKNKTALCGAFLLTPNINSITSNVDYVEVIDMSNGVVKISSRLSKSFYSNNGKICNIMLGDQKNIYEWQETPEASNQRLDQINKTNDNGYFLVEDQTKKKVAAPLIYGNKPSVILSFLKNIDNKANSGSKNFDIIPIEGFSYIENSGEFEEIINTIKSLNYHGINIAFINDLRPKNQSSIEFSSTDYHLIFSKKIERQDSDSLERLKNTNYFLSSPTAKAFIDLKFNFPINSNWQERVSPSNNQLEISDIELKTSEPNLSNYIKIKYVPDFESFTKSLKIAHEILPNNGNIIIEALPESSLPERYKNLAEKITDSGQKIYLGFKYNGQNYIAENGTEFTEGTDEKASYLAAKWISNNDKIKLCGIFSPSNFEAEQQWAAAKPNKSTNALSMLCLTKHHQNCCIVL